MWNKGIKTSKMNKNVLSIDTTHSRYGINFLSEHLNIFNKNSFIQLI